MDAIGDRYGFATKVATKLHKAGLQIRGDFKKMSRLYAEWLPNRFNPVACLLRYDSRPGIDCNAISKRATKTWWHTAYAHDFALRTRDFLLPDPSIMSTLLHQCTRISCPHWGNLLLCQIQRFAYFPPLSYRLWRRRSPESPLR